MPDTVTHEPFDFTPDPSPIDRVVEEGIRQGVFPGAAYAIAHRGRVTTRAMGRYTYCPDSPEVRTDTIWDLASVSKVLGTTTAAMILNEEGKLDVEAPVASVLPEFAQAGKDRITFRNLLVHDSGLIAFRPYHKKFTEPDDVVSAVYSEGLQYPTGSKMVYSDLNMIALAEAMERLSGLPLDAFLQRRVLEPLGLRDTGYARSVAAPSGIELPALDVSRCAPTENVEEWRANLHNRRRAFRDGERCRVAAGVTTKFPDAAFYIQGEVHDPTAMTLGGVAGHAGLFSTVHDVSALVMALLSGRVVRRETLENWTRRQSELSSRALGWDTKSAKSSAGEKFGPRSFGHTGYTGTSVWVDPDRDLIAVLLANRVHPTSENTKIIAFRPRFHDAVVDAL